MLIAVSGKHETRASRMLVQHLGYPKRRAPLPCLEGSLSSFAFEYPLPLPRTPLGDAYDENQAKRAYGSARDGSRGSAPSSN